ncbi:heme exporter protein CcmD [Billgrantia gudaonensis]|uniref:Heme exporter protein D n=1 Tax=Billgrantia gudaonensis TaxID=376427 RepID=A0A1G8RHD8_9GAMM|nr:heme exporter protein CcmD [Halomonas gudaonensis]SDJ16407.1 heme exporter protein D [Halomonas gudaonensis]
MAFDSFQAFLAMGGHAPYVWAAWAVTLALLVGSGLHARVEHRRTLRDLARRVRRERRRESTAAGGAATIQHDGGGYTNDSETQA